MQTFGKTQTTKCLKVSYPPLDLFFCGFPEGFYKTKQHIEKTKNTQENQRQHKQPLGKPTKQSF